MTQKSTTESAPPPWHTLAFIFGLAAFLVRRLPSLESLDRVANLETISKVSFPDLLTLPQVAWIRLGLGSVMALVVVYMFLVGKWEQTTMYYSGTKLKAVRIPFRGVYWSGSLGSGLRAVSSFTIWSVTVEALAFLLLGGIPLYYYAERDEESPPRPPRWLMRLALVCWEIAAPTSILVSAVVKYVLWPKILASPNLSSGVFSNWRALILHNWNVLSCLVEGALLGGLPVRYSDVSFAPLFGMIYVLFSYLMMHSWSKPKHGPQFIYPFLDTTLSWMTTICLLMLLGVLSLAFGLFCWLDHVLTESMAPVGVGGHLAAVVVLGAAVCRFRD